MNDENQMQAVPSAAISVGIDIEKQTYMAKQYPRTLKAIIKDVLEELEVVPEFASKSYYSIPYKNEMGGTTNIEGPSIKAAMSLARRWGNCVNAARIHEERGDRILVEGVFLDLETGLITVKQHSVTRNYWSKQLKKVVPLRDDRLNMAIQAGMSKAVRNAILASLPVSLVEAYIKKAKQVASGNFGAKPDQKKLTIEDRLKKAKDMFIKLGITENQWNDYLGGSSLEPEELLAHLIGLYNSIEDGNKTIEEVFGEKEVQEPEIEGQVKKDELFKKPKQIK